MRYRALTAAGDYRFGEGSAEFYVDVPQAPAQAALTRLRLMTDEWFLNLEEGTPYNELILGFGTQPFYDQVIQERVLNTPGVKSITEYRSDLNEDRELTITMTIDTIYGVISLSAGVYIPGNIGRLDSTFVLDVNALY